MSLDPMTLKMLQEGTVSNLVKINLKFRTNEEKNPRKILLLKTDLRRNVKLF